LRHQLTVLQKNAPPRLHLQRFERLLWVLLSRWRPGWVEANINTPTREWTWPARKRSMGNLVRTADQALVCLDEWIQKDIGIKHVFEFVRYVASIKSTAKLSTLVESRCWGRTPLKQDLQSLKILFGDGCELEAESAEFERESNGLAFKSCSAHIRMLHSEYPKKTS
ncbi:MAG TPA: hypothetical protein VNO32_02645, partial [Candidatus Acidoferrum sp.]|nr:hypothetical protein [Candidatus Acidoferrum sp.]